MAEARSRRAPTRDIPPGELLQLVDTVLKQKPNAALSERSRQLRLKLLHGQISPKTELLALLREAQNPAKQLDDHLSQVFVERIATIQTSFTQQLRQSYEVVVAESGCGCLTPKIMYDLEGNSLCQHCGRFISDEINRPQPSKNSNRRQDPYKSQVEYFETLLDNLEGGENSRIDPEHREIIRRVIWEDLNPESNPGWTLYVTSTYLREKLKAEGLPQYYPHLIKLYREIVGTLPYRQPEGFRVTMRGAFRILLEVQSRHFPNSRRGYPFILFNLFRTLYPSNPEIEKLESFYQLDKQSFTEEQRRQWMQIRDEFVRQVRLSDL